MICFSPHNLAYFGRFLSSIAKCGGGKSNKMRTFVRLTPLRLELALTLMFPFKNHGSVFWQWRWRLLEKIKNVIDSNGCLEQNMQSVLRN